jgi:AraC-like DNA-binding protein
MRADDLTKPTVPVSYALLVLEAAAAHGAAPDDVLARARIAPAQLDDPNGRTSVVVVGTLLLRAIELSGEPGLGYEMGLRTSLTSHGLMGYAMMSSSTLREAIELGIELMHLRVPVFDAELRVEGAVAMVTVVETVPLEPVRQPMLDLFLVGLARLGPSLTEHRFGLDDVDLWFDGPEPSHHERWIERLPPCRFEMGVNQVRFPASHLERRPETANPVTANLVAEQCRRELEELGLDDDVAGRVRAVLRTAGSGYPALVELADRLGMSTRTLKRRLHEHGTSYQHEVDTARRAEALRLLGTTSLSVEQIAARLGYADASSFRRAFQAWTATTPGAFRDRRRAAEIR